MNIVFLTYAGPPLLGAFIGYLTNRVAIRMLFRPLKRWRLLGIPVPMTPGVIPSKRHELALNIGEMVGTHLLTSKDIGTALSEERFQVHLAGLVDTWVGDILKRDLGPVPILVPDRFQKYLKVGVRTVKYQIHTGVHRYIGSDEFARMVSGNLRDQLQALGERPLNSIVSPAERQRLYGFLDTLVRDLLAAPRTEQWLSENLQENFKQAASEGKTVADYLPEQLQDFIVETILQHVPELLRQMSVMLSEPPVQERIIRAVRSGVDDFITSLGPIGAMAGGFLDMNALEKNIRSYLTDKQDDIQAWLENPEVRERFSAVLVEQVRKYMDTPVSSLLENMGDEKLDSICGEIAAQVLAILRTGGVADALTSMLRESFEEMLDQGRMSMGEIGAQFMAEDSRRGLRKTLADEAVAMLRSHRVRRLLDRMLNSMFDELLQRPVGRLNDLLPVGVREGLTGYGVLTINRILIREVPSLVESLNIRRIVTEKVDSLDLLRLERLLLSIMEEQFKYINLFGALLGFLIGLANLLLLHLP